MRLPNIFHALLFSRRRGVAEPVSNNGLGDIIPCPKGCTCKGSLNADR